MTKKKEQPLYPRAKEEPPVDTQKLEAALDAQRIRAIQTGHDFVFSVIVPVYNTEDYIEECIQSVVYQTIGFGDIQLVLVDDGSKDGSANICQRWADLFPENITLIRQKNAGVSAARNAGLAMARGLWVNFLDSDDMWTTDAFARMLVFYADHPRVRAVALRHWFFDARNAPHVLDYKFDYDREVDLFHDIDCVQHSFSNLFVEHELVKDIRFDTSLEVSEDFALVNDMLLDLGRYGACSCGAYLYRKRHEGGSAIDTSTQKLSYYEQTPKRCYKRLFQISLERFGRVIPYVQYCVMYDLQWRIKATVSPKLSDKDVASYRKAIVDLLQYIDDEVIVAQRNLVLNEVLYVLSLKYGVSVGEISKNVVLLNKRFVWLSPQGPVALRSVFDLSVELVLEFVHIEQNEIRLEGYSRFLSELASPYLRIQFLPSEDAEPIEVTYTNRVDRIQRVAFADDSFCLQCFTVSLPWDGKKAKISAQICLGEESTTASFDFGKFFGLNKKLSYTYWDRDGYLLRAPDGDRDAEGNPKKQKIVITRANPAKSRMCENLLRMELSLTLEWGTHYAAWRAIASEAKLRRELSPTKVWLISDRPLTAGDNGEALFAWLCEHPQQNVKPIFCLSARSADWERVCSYGGQVVDLDSFEYKRLFLRANVIASSSGDEWVINAMAGRRQYLKDLYGFKYAFLQHGVIKDDLSGWFNRWGKNASLFVTSAKREWESIAFGKYGYGTDVVKQTGLPRHDALLEEAKTRQPSKAIYVMPTWRKSLAVGPFDAEEGMYPRNPLFEESSYYKFYQELITNSRLQACLAEHGYRIKLAVHPNHMQEANKFEPGEHSDVITHITYRDAFVDAAALVTDYSSVPFDFALLKRPVVYAQFDMHEFFASHSYEKGYFKYKRDGFGPVCDTLDQTVAELIALIQNDCKMMQKYKERVDEFFGDQPACRCQMVTDELLRLSNDNLQR